MIGYWPFNGNANDLSGNGNHGTVIGATLTSDRFGNPNKAYYFDGVSNYISILNSTSLNPQNAITLCAWYKSEAFYGAGYSAIIDKGYTSHAAPTYQYKLGAGGSYNSENSFGFSVITNNSENRASTSTQFWTPNNWYFLAGIYDGSTVKLYVNNQLIQSISVSGAISSYNTPLYFGNNTTLNDFVQGVIDDVRIYGRALEPTELTALYNEENPATTGLTSFTKRNTFEIYPNPASSHLLIENSNVSDASQIKIYNALGQVVYQSVMDKKLFYIDRSSLPLNGIYIVKVLDPFGNTLQTKKIILE